MAFHEEYGNRSFTFMQCTIPNTVVIVFDRIFPISGMPRAVDCATSSRVIKVDDELFMVLSWCLVYLSENMPTRRRLGRSRVLRKISKEIPLLSTSPFATRGLVVQFDKGTMGAMLHCL